MIFPLFPQSYGNSMPMIHAHDHRGTALKTPRMRCARTRGMGWLPTEKKTWDLSIYIYIYIHASPPQNRRFSLSCFEDWVNSLLFKLSILEWFSISSDNCVEQRWESFLINSFFSILDFISNIKFITGVKSFKASSKIFNNLSSGNSIPHPSTIVIPSFGPLINISIFSKEELETYGKKWWFKLCQNI